METKTLSPENCFFIRINGKYVRVLFSEIIYVVSRQNYVQLVTIDKNYVILNTMKQMEQALPEDMFCRIHRSYIVSLNHITSFDNESVFLGDQELPLRDHYRFLLQTRLNILTNDVRGPKNVRKEKVDHMDDISDS